MGAHSLLDSLATDLTKNTGTLTRQERNWCTKYIDSLITSHDAEW